jgi:hypothetical protein
MSQHNSGTAGVAILDGGMVNRVRAGKVFVFNGTTIAPSAIHQANPGNHA